ncbi:hypothetical protein NLJ89_g6725 [Agrocybe chaxingu]|uniref:Uncharacterized protein n=1 Tax=Agrocybe chaxingu TaxID=84603 RepID=A0A9W8MTT5_9AGAR|nr:hypothetical protein NLJ89_g6725 [Agrocybe chaxingu]
MHTFKSIKHLSAAFLLTALALANTPTLYRIGQLGRDQAPAVTAIGVGPEGGTTYEQLQRVYIGESTFVDGTPPAVTTSTWIGEETVGLFVFEAVFVQHASWAYRQIPDQSGRFNIVELNCTLPAEGREGSECVEVVRLTSGPTSAPTTTATEVSTFPGTLVGRFTATGPIPTALPPPTATANGANVAGRDIGRWSWTSAMTGFAVLGAWSIAW